MTDKTALFAGTLRPDGLDVLNPPSDHVAGFESSDYHDMYEDEINRLRTEIVVRNNRLIAIRNLVNAE